MVFELVLSRTEKQKGPIRTESTITTSVLKYSFYFILLNLPAGLCLTHLANLLLGYNRHLQPSLHTPDGKKKKVNNADKRINNLILNPNGTMWPHPGHFRLKSNMPNPFTPDGDIRLHTSLTVMPHARQASIIKIRNGKNNI